MHTTKTLNYQKMLAEIAEERGLTELAKHIKEFSISVIEKPVYNITKFPEAECSGCQ